MAITKEQLDKHITEDYDRLLKIIKGQIFKYRSKLEPIYVLNLAYEKCVERLDEIEPDKISHFITSFARTSTFFRNNPINSYHSYNYRHPQLITNYTEMVDDNVEDKTQYFMQYTEAQDEYILEDYEVGYDIIEMLNDFTPTINVLDRMIADDLYDYIIDKNSLDLETKYNCNKRDSHAIRRRLNKLYKDFLVFVENNKNNYKKC